MRTERFVLAPCLIVLASCASASTRSDLNRVRELTALPLPLESGSEAVADAEERVVDQEVTHLLSAPLDADAAVRIALLNNRALRATLRDLGIARGELVQAGLLPNPNVEFDLRRSTDKSLPLQADFYVEYDITAAILTGYAEDAASSDLEAARLAAAGETLDLAFRTRGAFYALQATEQRYLIAQRVLDALAAGRDAARALYAAGNVPALDVAAQEVAYEDARATVAEIELEVLDRREDVQQLLGLYGEATRWEVEKALPMAPKVLDLPVDIERDAIASNLGLREMESRLEAIAHRTRLTHTRGLLPDITIDAHAEQDNDDWEFGGGATLSVPIFDRQQGRLAAQEAEFDALHERYLADAVAIRSQARRIKNRLTTAHARAKQYQEIIVPARERVVRESQLQYNAMQIGVFQLLEAHRARLDSELAYAAALQEFWTARAALETTLKGRITEAMPRVSTRSLGGGQNQGGGH